MNCLRFLFLICLVSAFQACSSAPEKKAEPVETKEELVVKENFPTGVLIDKVACKSDTTQNYSLYLPKGYDTKKEFPIVYIFDAHGTGKLPVSMYKELAEKYGYILVGSNNSQNGTAWPQTQKIAATLFTDTKNRLTFDPNRFYTMGFSGGARVANALTIENGAITGVICCGAASPASQSTNPRNNYTFFGIAGNADFNFTEMNTYNLLELAGHKVKHAMITFDGKHEWPAANIMEEAFLWLDLNAMRKNTMPKNDTLLSSHLKQAKDKLDKLLKQNKEYEAYELCLKTINYYELLGDLNPFFEAYKKLQTNANVDKQLKQNETDWNIEEKLKQEYMNNLQTQNMDWWKKDIASLNQKIKAGKNSNKALAQKRLLSYLSLVCYMQTTGAMKQNNLKAAEYFGNLYKLVDPTNTEAHYLLANIYMGSAQIEKALKSLDEAVKNGFTDVKRMENDPMFQNLKDDVTFIEIKGKIKK